MPVIEYPRDTEAQIAEIWRAINGIGRYTGYFSKDNIPLGKPVISQTAEVYKDMTVDKIKAKLDYLIGEIGNYGEEYSGSYLPDLYGLQELVSSLSK